jgi:GT2 family glycosyltransferase
MKNNRTVDVSFVIPVRNDATRLRGCLKSIRENQYPDDRIEIIVVDNGSHDESVLVAREAGAEVLKEPGRRVAELRNIGASIARGRILAFVDADHLLGPCWIEAAVQTFKEDETIAAVGSLCRAPEDGTWVQRAYDNLRGRRVGRQPVEWLGAGNMAVIHDAFERLGGFDAGLETCEDVELCRKLRSAGQRLVSDDRLLSVHLGDPSTLSALFRGELWRGRNNLVVSFRRPVVLRELPSAVVPMIQLAGLATAIPVFASGGGTGMALACVALLPLAVIPLLRAARMSLRTHCFEARAFRNNVAVAFVYDLARALAVVAFATHEIRGR